MILIYLRSLFLPYQIVVSQMESSFGFGFGPGPRTSPIRWLHIIILPTVVVVAAVSVLLMATRHVHSSSTSTSKWIHNCTTVLMGTITTYLMLIALVECTVRAVLLAAGIELGSTATMTTNPNHQSRPGRCSAALDRCIKRSLLKRNIDCQTETGNTNDETKITVPSSSCCGKEDKQKTVATVRGCCNICLEDFKPGDSVVSGRGDCCKNNVFHEVCIAQWLRISNSCPHCRRPMLEPEEDDETNDGCMGSGDRIVSENENEANPETDEADNNGHARYFRSQFRIKIDTATRLRNEILSHCVEATSSQHQNHFW